MNKIMSSIIKSIFMATFIILMVNVNPCLADVVPIDHENYQASQALEDKDVNLNKDVDAAISDYKSKKNLTGKDKQQYKSKFKLLMGKCLSLKEDIKSQISLTKKKDLEETKAYEEASKKYAQEQKLKPANKDDERSYLNRGPRKTDYSGSLDSLKASELSVSKNEKRLTDILNSLGEKNINKIKSQSKKKSSEIRNNNLFAFAGFSFLSLIVSLLLLIRLKDRLNINRG